MREFDQNIRIEQCFCSAVSKTINLPEDISFEAFVDIYSQAYDLGCKGCTTYRPNPVTGAVIEASGPAGPESESSPEAAAEAALSPGEVVYMTEPLDRPPALPGRTYKLRWPESDHAIYITLNDGVQDGRQRPFEIFINSKNMEHYAWTLALTRMISAVFRRGGDVSFVVEELKAVFDPRGGAWLERKYVPSLLAAIGAVIERHMIDTGFLKAPDEGERPVAESLQVARLPGAAAPGSAALPRRLRQCPKCGAASLIHQEGCDLCTSCGHSKCV